MFPYNTKQSHHHPPPQTGKEINSSSMKQEHKTSTKRLAKNRKTHTPQPPPPHHTNFQQKPRSHLIPPHFRPSNPLNLFPLSLPLPTPTPSPPQPSPPGVKLLGSNFSQGATSAFFTTRPPKPRFSLASRIHCSGIPGRAAAEAVLLLRLGGERGQLGVEEGVAVVSSSVRFSVWECFVAVVEDWDWVWCGRFIEGALVGWRTEIGLLLEGSGG